MTVLTSGDTLGTMTRAPHAVSCRNRQLYGLQRAVAGVGGQRTDTIALLEALKAAADRTAAARAPAGANGAADEEQLLLDSQVSREEPHEASLARSTMCPF